MTRTLAFLHTSPVHVQTFDHLAAELCPEITLAHVVDEALLHSARAEGVTHALEQRIGARLDALLAQGAGVIVCTCSTIGSCAEEAARQRGAVLVRVDWAMTQQAVALGEHIAIVAAIPSTLVPTRSLIAQAALEAGKQVKMLDVLCQEDAWLAFERGDLERYYALVAQAAAAASQVDVIVLAQASMAGATPLCAHLSVPVLTSPRLGLDTAIALYRNLVH